LSQRKGGNPPKADQGRPRRKVFLSKDLKKVGTAPAFPAAGYYFKNRPRLPRSSLWRYVPATFFISAEDPWNLYLYLNFVVKKKIWVSLCS